jgi:hypothetical protein
VGSIFTAPVEKLVLTLSPGIEGEYALLTKQREARDCREVGLCLNWDDLEYTFWWLLEAP